MENKYEHETSTAHLADSDNTELRNVDKDRYVIRDSRGALWCCFDTREQVKEWLMTGNNVVHNPSITDTKKGMTYQIAELADLVKFVNNVEPVILSLSHTVDGSNKSTDTYATHRPIYDIFAEALELIEQKGADYSDKVDWHSNFKYADAVSESFPEAYKPYAVMIGIKLARLSQLLQPDREVNNESIKDTLIDLMNYCALMIERYELESRVEDDE